MAVMCLNSEFTFIETINWKQIRNIHSLYSSLRFSERYRDVGGGNRVNILVSQICSQTRVCNLSLVHAAIPNITSIEYLTENKSQYFAKS